MKKSTGARTFTWQSRFAVRLLRFVKKILPRSWRTTVNSIIYIAILPTKMPWQQKASSELAGVKATTLSPSESFTPSKSTLGDLPKSFQLERTFTAIQNLEVTHGVLQDNAVFNEAGICIKEPTLDRILRGMPKDEKSVYGVNIGTYDCEAVAISTTYLDNYFHWFHDIISRILLMPEYTSKYYSGYFQYPYQSESLKLLGIPDSHLLPLSFGERAKFKKVIAFNNVEQGHPALIRTLSRLPSMLDLPSNPNYPKRIYISREDSKGRRNILNDAELVHALEGWGFKKMIFSGLPIIEQIAILQNAEAVIFPQGASVLNMAFCKPQTKFLELYSPRFLVTLGVNFANTLKQQYTTVIGTDANTSRDNAKSCFTVTPKQVQAGLQTLELL